MTFCAKSIYSFGTRKRLVSFFSAARPFFSCPRCCGQNSAGVNALPKSCVSAAKRTTEFFDNTTACCNTIMVCTPVSISGWCIAGWGTPNMASTSGKITASAPHFLKTSKKTYGVCSLRARLISCQTRSAIKAVNSPLFVMPCISAIVSGATVKPKCA